MKSAAVAMLLRNGKLLCVWNQRYNGWSMPGGRIEDGEEPYEGLARELREEVGITSFFWKKVFEGRHSLPVTVDRASYVHVFSITTNDEPRAMEEGCPITWLTPAEFIEKSPFASFYVKVFAGLGLT